MRTIILSAFPGMGKSYAVKHSSQYKMLDLESSEYSWIETDEGKVRNPMFPQNYIEVIKKLVYQGSYQVIFISSHKIVRQALQENKIKYYFVYPDISLKEEYIKRFKQRGNNQNFIEQLKKNWELWINQIQNEKSDKKYCYKTKILQKDFYLTYLFRQKRI